MKRRDLWAVAALVSVPGAVAVAQEARIYRVGVLVLSRTDIEGLSWRAFVAEMAARNYVQGRNLTFVFEFARGERVDALDEAALALAGRKVDVIYAVGGSQIAVAAKRATTKVPIVFEASNDPVAFGLVSSLARPGGNVTGLAVQGADAAAKSVEYLREAIGHLPSVAVVQVQGTTLLPWYADFLRKMSAAAKATRTKLEFFDISDWSAVEQLLPELVRLGFSGVMQVEGPNNLGAAEYRRIADLFLKYRLPSICGAQDGCLLLCEVAESVLGERGAYYVGRILKGTLPADLPVEIASKVRLAVNVRTARALGLRLPKSLLLRADELVE
jgi:putative ABC transport system substrate-binding protein